MMKKCGVHQVAWILVIIGGLNWLLVGLFSLNVVNQVFGSLPTVERIIYVVVGLAAVAMLGEGKCKMCKVGG